MYTQGCGIASDTDKWCDGPCGPHEHECTQTQGRVSKVRCTHTLPRPLLLPRARVSVSSVLTRGTGGGTGVALGGEASPCKWVWLPAPHAGWQSHCHEVLAQSLSQERMSSRLGGVNSRNTDRPCRPTEGRSSLCCGLHLLPSVQSLAARYWQQLPEPGRALA